MNKQFKKILLLYKRSAYSIYSMDKGGLSRKNGDPQFAEELKYFKRIHDEHYQNLHEAMKVLMENGIRFDEAFRGKKINYSKYDLVITVGGDGTFLEASRNISDQILFGINSVPDHSVGNFCLIDVAGLRKVIQKVIDGKFKIEHLERIRVAVDGNVEDALNDVLICHQNPAFLCRYGIKVGNRSEVQRSSGLWVATPAGSTGAIHSAGGVVIKRGLKAFQYKPRELYQGLFKPYQLRGGIVDPRTKMEVLSFMRRGVIYIDGAHHKFSFGYGQKAKISISPQPLRTIKLK